jgi:hypothetical protein
MNTHNQINELLVGFTLGELNTEQIYDVEKHLAECGLCRNELENIRALLKTTEDMKTKVADEQLCESAQNLLFASIEKTKQEPTLRQKNLWRTIMKSRIIKFAAAAVIVVAAILSINIIDRSVPAAFGIDQVIAAYNSISFLHVKQFKANQEEPLEFWIKSDEQGRIANARYYLPEHVSPEDGAKLITWSPERAELWFKRKNGYLIFQTKRVEAWMQSLIEQSQPKLVMEKLLEGQKAGTVEIDIQQPQEKQKPVTITATYKTSLKKEIYYIDQGTDLITYIEFYHTENNQDVLDSTMEFYDYNVPIDEKMFTLKDEVPKDVTVVNQLEQLIGIPQGDMTDEQAAAETVRQFFQALIDKDYKKAGSIYSGVSEEKAKEIFGRLNVTAIVSIGAPTPHPETGPHSFRVPCEVEITAPDGQKTTWKPYGPFARCGDDEMHPDRWIIHGGI